MPVTYEQADHVAEQLSRKLRGREGMRGVGIEPDEEEGFVVSVRIAPGATAPRLATRVNGVAVRLRRRKMARAVGA